MLWFVGSLSWLHPKNLNLTLLPQVVDPSVKVALPRKRRLHDWPDNGSERYAFGMRTEQFKKLGVGLIKLHLAFIFIRSDCTI